MTSENWNLADYYQGESYDETVGTLEQEGQQPTLPCFPTGRGQSDTHTRTLNDGRQNPYTSAGKPYATVTGKDIANLVMNPPSVPKERGQWFIPSTYSDHDARAHDVQREKGAFRWLTLDVDENDLDLSDIDAALSEVIGDARRIIYSSRGATEANKKWRALVPIKGDLAGAEFTDTQNALFDLLEEASDGALIPDRALSRPAQLVYLPNRGEFYQHHIHKGAGLMDLTPDCAIIARREKVATEKAKAAQDAQEARERRAAQRKAIAQGDDALPVDHFNAAHTVADLLDRYGYTQAGSSNDWKSPFQSSGSYATRNCGEFWISLSGSDAAQEIGAETKDGHRYGDAFDLFCHFEHEGNFMAAVRAYAQEAGLDRQERTTSATGQRSGTQAHTSDGEPRPNVDDDQIDLSHDALATEMGRRAFNANARYVSPWGKWLFWNDTRWQIDTRRMHMTRTREFLRKRAFELQAWAEHKAANDIVGGDKILNWADQEARTLRNKNTVAAIESLAQSNGPSVASPDDFDTDRLLLGTPGGTVDLRTGKIRQARRDDMITKLTTVAPKSGTPELWLKFLHEIFNGDRELVAFMQRAAGYALTGETREHKLLFLYGTGRNGKSVFLNTLFHIWGDYARRAHAATFLNSSGEKHPTDVAGLQGARLVAGSELPKGKTWDESVIKDLTGGDTMTARFMRGDYFDFDPHLTLMIAGNNMPSFRGVDEAIRARVVLVPFTVTIPPERRDQKLPEKLLAEAGQILGWAIEGVLQWQARGLDVPASVMAASAEYFDDEDTTGQFIADETLQDATSFVTTTDLHKRFQQWCEAQGLNPWTLRTLQKEIAGRGFKTHRMTKGSGFLGLRLK